MLSRCIRIGFQVKERHSKYQNKINHKKIQIQIRAFRSNPLALSLKFLYKYPNISENDFLVTSFLKFMQILAISQYNLGSIANNSLLLMTIGKRFCKISRIARFKDSPRKLSICVEIYKEFRLKFRRLLS